MKQMIAEHKHFTPILIYQIIVANIAIYENKLSV